MEGCAWGMGLKFQDLLLVLPHSVPLGCRKLMPLYPEDQASADQCEHF